MVDTAEEEVLRIRSMEEGHRRKVVAVVPEHPVGRIDLVEGRKVGSKVVGIDFVIVFEGPSCGGIVRTRPESGTVMCGISSRTTLSV